MNKEHSHHWSTKVEVYCPDCKATGYKYTNEDGSTHIICGEIKVQPNFEIKADKTYKGSYAGSTQTHIMNGSLKDEPRKT